MLTIKRVPTVVSNYQEDASQADNLAAGCGRNCLAKCCLRVSKLPLYAFKKNEDESLENGAVIYSLKKPPISLLNNLLLGQWEERIRRGLFRYDVTICETKIISGKYGFIAQLNDGRHLKKRPTEFCVDQVLQPFDENKFNFMKVGQEEVLFRFEPSSDKKSHFFPSFPVDADSTPNVVAINVSPIEFGHVLLIPRILDCLPQRIDQDSLFIALHMAKEAADPFFRLGYNSLGAFATINHLHFQAYHLNVPFPVEKALTQKIMMTGKASCDDGVTFSQLLNYPVRGLVFEHGNTMQSLSDAAAKSCICLQNNNIPFNVLIADCGKRIFLFPQCYAKKQALGGVSWELLDTQVNPAVWEISGHMVLKRRKDYDDASEECAWRLLAEVSLPEERFQEVKTLIFEASGLREVGLGETNMTNEEDVHKSHAPKVAAHLPQDCLVLH